jgi:hypothetical protein
VTNTPTSLRRKRVIALPLLLSVALAASAPSRVAAQDAYGCVDELDDDEVARRTSAIAREFRSHERHARAFRFGWMSLFAVFAVAEFAFIGPRAEGAQRWNAYISGVGATTAMVQLVALPMPEVWARRRIERMPSDTPEQRRAQLRYALDALELAANGDRIIHSALSHASAVVWSVGWGTLLSVKFDKPLVSAIAFLGGPVMNETRILTAPNWATQAWVRTRAGFCWDRYVDDAPREAYWDEPETEARLSPTLGGLSLHLTF